MKVGNGRDTSKLFHCYSDAMPMQCLCNANDIPGAFMFFLI